MNADLLTPAPTALRDDDDDGDRADRDLEDLAESARDPVGEPDESICCAACDHEVTRAEYRTERDGGFEHSFPNPAGIVFHIGCFAEANGCGAIGEASSEFSWFAGYTWRVALCKHCRTHLGWLFESSDDTFWGQILPRLYTHSDEYLPASSGSYRHHPTGIPKKDVKPPKPRRMLSLRIRP
jgi:hypothetical protein